jgi:hypothetical protein
MEEEKSHVEVLIEKTGDFTRKKVELYKLKAVDKAADVVSTIAADVTIISIIVLFVLVINIGLALWLGELMGHNYYGFFSVAGFYALSGIIFYTFRDKLIKHPVRNSIIKHALKID